MAAFNSESDDINLDRKSKARLREQNKNEWTADFTQDEGSPDVFVNGLALARIGDNQSGDLLFHPPNPQVTGSPDVFAND